MPYVNVKKALKMPKLLTAVRSIPRLIKAIKAGSVTARSSPAGAATGRIGGQVDVGALTSHGVPALKSNGKKAVGGV